MKVALVREVPDTINECELTFIERQPIDVENARRQHEEYVEKLRDLGVHVRHLDSTQHLPDSVFVEDAAVVLDELAIITRPGAESRLEEVLTVEEALQPYRECVGLSEDARLDGGDVLVVGRRIFIGLSGRSNERAVDEVAVIVEPHGYAVEAISVTGCLHLKSAVTAVGHDAVLLNPEFVDRSAFEGMEIVEVHPDEPHGANVVLIGGELLYGAEYPLTLARLSAAGYTVHVVESSEVAKAEGAVTCCSILIDVET